MTENRFFFFLIVFSIHVHACFARTPYPPGLPLQVDAVPSARSATFASGMEGNQFQTPSSSAAVSPQQWNVIGPFPTGMRELGADPLFAFLDGGIFDVPDPSPRSSPSFPSELGVNGTVTWSTWSMNNESEVFISFDHLYKESFLQEPYGWAVLEWQGWAVANVTVVNSSTYLLQCEGVHEMYLGTTRYPCDFYSLGTLYTPVMLGAGVHTARVHAVSDIRTGGNTDNVTFTMKLHDSLPSATPTTNEITFSSSSVSIVVIPNSIVSPSIVNGSWASPFLSVSIVNLNTTHYLRGVCVTSAILEVVDANTNITSPPLELNVTSSVTDVAASQSTVVPFSVAPIPPHIAQAIAAAPPASLYATITIILETSTGANKVSAASVLNVVTFSNDSYAFTFLDYDGSTQTAAVKPPANPCTSSSTGCPVLLAAHGAGVLVTSDAWTSGFASVTA
eukprot:TRINITY_DN5317_c0_g1_i2.p1 TRINITY_DN5317_c0_g1~~TRINITY_DN5317_c0_g1_i2.p1  ORF type:complete len:466 (+),score=62.11 TRINITY_DN5317_c0_g1_i2:53-1399(+)